MVRAVEAHLQLADGRRVAVENGILIGRVAPCQVVIDDGKASRRHARISVEGSIVEIEDLESTNGTLLNGRPVTRRVLRDGDEIRIGKTVIVFREGAAPADARPAVPAHPRSQAPAAPTRPAQDFAPGDDLLADESAEATKPSARSSGPSRGETAEQAKDGGSASSPSASNDDLLEEFDELDLDAVVSPRAPAPPPQPESRPQDESSRRAGDTGADQDLLEAFGDDFELDLGGDAAPTASPPPAAPRPASPPPAPARPARQSSKPAPTKRPSDDEPSLDDLVQVRPAAREAEPARSSAQGATREQAPARRQGVLQYSTKARDAGVLSRDVGQTGGLLRVVYVVLGLAIAGGLGYLAVLVTSG
jgi:hypothetical protein